jgi:hypothetical protein
MPKFVLFVWVVGFPDCWGLGRVLPHNGVMFVVFWLGPETVVVVGGVGTDREPEPRGNTVSLEVSQGPHTELGSVLMSIVLIRALSLGLFAGRAMYAADSSLLASLWSVEA